MKFKKIDLPYAYDALEPKIDATTIETHYEKHHKGYETKFNEAIAGSELEKYDSIEELMLDFSNIDDSLKMATKNAGGGLINHNLFFKQFSKEYSINKEGLENFFNGLEILKETIVSEGMKVFGSGWVWLVKEGQEYKIITTPNQENPWMQGIKDVVFGIDLWEHSYYLKYKQDRKSYIEACLELILDK